MQQRFTALRLSEEDQTTIVTLKKEVEKAWKLVDASHEKVAAHLLKLNCCTCVPHTQAARCCACTRLSSLYSLTE